MDYINIRFYNTYYKYYGKIGDFYIARNYDIVENPGGNFLVIWKGNYTQPMDVDYELFVPYSNDILPSFAGSGDRYFAEIFLERFNRDFTARIYNMIIAEKSLVKIIKTPNQNELPAGDHYLYKGRFTAYFMEHMS